MCFFLFLLILRNNEECYISLIPIPIPLFEKSRIPDPIPIPKNFEFSIPDPIPIPENYECYIPDPVPFRPERDWECRNEGIGMIFCNPACRY